MLNMRENSRKKKKQLNETSLASAKLRSEPGARNPPAPGERGDCASTSRPRLRGPGDAPSCVRRHRQTPTRTYLASSPPARPESPRRAGSAGHGRANPPLTTTSPGVPRSSRRGRRALPGAGSLLKAGTTTAKGALRGTTGGLLPMPLITPELPEQGWQQTWAAPLRKAPMSPAGSASIRLRRAGSGRSRGSLGRKG